jgi:tellurite resistance protein TehA-like permease
MPLRLMPLAAASLSLTAGAAMTRALITHHGLGAMEYATGAAIVALAIVLTVRLSRRAIQHP